MDNSSNTHMDDLNNINLKDDLENIGNIDGDVIDHEVAEPKDKSTIGALRQLTQAITKMQKTLQDFVEKYDKASKAGRF